MPVNLSAPDPRFILPLVLWIVSKDGRDPYARHHAAEALNFQITLFIAYMVSAVLILVLIGLSTLKIR